VSAENSQEEIRNPFLGEIETEVVGMRQHQAGLDPGEQINVERQANSARHRRAIRVENGQFQVVGHLPGKMSSWLAPLIDQGKIHLDGYVPQASAASEETSDRRRVVLMVFQGEKGRRLLERAEPKSDLETLHQTVLQAYQSAQSYHHHELVLGLAKGLQPLERQELLPETRLLLALLPRIAHEVRISQGVRAMVKFRDLLGTLIIGQSSHHHNLTFFPLLWPENHEPSHRLLSQWKRLDSISPQSEITSLAGALGFAAETLRQQCKRLVFPPGAAGVLVGRHERIIGLDLFDSPATLQTHWERLSEAYLFAALRDPAAAPPTAGDHARRFVERLGNAARPRFSDLALGEELEIGGAGVVGAALLFGGRICHLWALGTG